LQTNKRPLKQQISKQVACLPGCKLQPATVYGTVNLQLTLLLAYDVFPVILQNLRPSAVLSSKETVCEKFQIAREKVVVTITTTVTYIVAPMVLTT